MRKIVIEETAVDPDSVEQRIAAMQRELDQAEEKAGELEDDDKLDSTWPNYQAYRGTILNGCWPRLTPKQSQTHGMRRGEHMNDQDWV